MHLCEDEVPLEYVCGSQPSQLWTEFSGVLLDQGGKSRFGCHWDTATMAMTYLGAESAYRSEFLDYDGAELAFVNGLYSVRYSAFDCMIVAGHRALHTVLNMRPGLPPAHAKGLPQLRFTTALWSRSGYNYPSLRSELRDAIERGDSTELIDRLSNELDNMASTLLGKTGKLPMGTRSETAASTIHASSTAEPAVVGRLAAVLRLRGGAGHRKGRKGKRKPKRKANR